MASKNRYHKITLGPSEKVTGRNSHVGMTCIADYLDPADNQRVLVLERPFAATPTKPRKAKGNVNAKPAQTDSPATAFPGEVAGRG